MVDTVAEVAQPELYFNMYKLANSEINFLRQKPMLKM